MQQEHAEFDDSNDWTDEQEQSYQLAVFTSQVMALAHREVLQMEQEIQTLETLWALPAPGESR